MLPLALGCTKVSFLFFYRRLFVVNKRSSNNVFLIGMIMFVFLWMVGFFLTFLFQCRLNFWALWTSPTAIAEHCTSDTPINLAFTITDLITDVAILVIPIPIIWRLNLSLSRKMSITAVFLFGAITVAASLTRVVLTARIFVEAFTADADPIRELFQAIAGYSGLSNPNYSHSNSLHILGDDRNWYCRVYSLPTHCLVLLQGLVMGSCRQSRQKHYGV